MGVGGGNGRGGCEYVRRKALGRGVNNCLVSGGGDNPPPPLADV